MHRTNTSTARSVVSELQTSLPEVESRTQGSRPRPRTQKNFEAKAKDRPSRGQGQGHIRKCSPKKKRYSKTFLGKIGLQKFFFRRSLLQETKKKRSLQIFRKVSGVFQRNFNDSKIVLSLSRGQANLRGLEASRPRTLKCVLEAKDVLEDSTSSRYVTYLHVTIS